MVNVLHPQPSTLHKIFHEFILDLKDMVKKIINPDIIYMGIENMNVLMALGLGGKCFASTRSTNMLPGPSKLEPCDLS